jgi:hypothetical protein
MKHRRKFIKEKKAMNGEKRHQKVQAKKKKIIMKFKNIHKQKLYHQCLQGVKAHHH